MNTITRAKKFVSVDPAFIAGVVALIISAGALQAADPPAVAPAPVLKPVPKSVFIIPTSSSEGRDPFFPNSTRAPGSAQPDRPRVDSGPALFVLNGVNLLPGSRTAIINGRTIAEGETAQIPTATGDVSVHLLEFQKNNAVVIQFGSQTNVLHMRNE